MLCPRRSQKKNDRTFAVWAFFLGTMSFSPPSVSIPQKKQISRCLFHQLHPLNEKERESEEGVVNCTFQIILLLLYIRLASHLFWVFFLGDIPLHVKSIP